ncbi:MAG: hypothetical protein AAF558_12560 [Verrucomicrobiota bacterium]
MQLKRLHATGVGLLILPVLLVAQDVPESTEVVTPEVETIQELSVAEEAASVLEDNPDRKTMELSGTKQGDWDLPVQIDQSVKIKKVYDFLNDQSITKTGKDRSLEYEFKFFNHGAITKAQLYNRKGQYYVVTWANDAAPANYTLRLDYRQGLTRDKVNTIKIPYPAAKGTFKGTFSITGDNYSMYGQILSWRVSVVRDGMIVAQEKSFVW